MDLTDDQIFEKIVNQCGRCIRNTLLPYEYEWTCIACGYNESMNSLKINKKNIVNRLKYAENKIFGICVDIHKIYECGDEFEKIKFCPH